MRTHEWNAVGNYNYSLFSCRKRIKGIRFLSIKNVFIFVLSLKLTIFISPVRRAKIDCIDVKLITGAYSYLAMSCHLPIRMEEKRGRGKQNGGTNGVAARSHQCVGEYVKCDLKCWDKPKVNVCPEVNRSPIVARLHAACRTNNRVMGEPLCSKCYNCALRIHGKSYNFRQLKAHYKGINDIRQSHYNYVTY